jgi:hypothetical protein
LRGSFEVDDDEEDDEDEQDARDPTILSDEVIREQLRDTSDLVTDVTLGKRKLRDFLGGDLNPSQLDSMAALVRLSGWVR